MSSNSAIYSVTLTVFFRYCHPAGNRSQFKAKQPPETGIMLIFIPYKKDKFERIWASMLSHQLPQFPPITSYLEALSELFDWIECGITVSLMPIARDSVALRNPTLDLPIALNIKKHFEKIRFAGVNHLCVDLHNQQSICRVEPYSMAATSSSEIVLQQLTYPMEDMQPFYPVKFKM